MPVTLPLPFRKLTVSSFGQRPITTQVVATSTALFAGFALFAAGADSGNEQITPMAATSEAPAADRAPAEKPAVSHDPAAWDPHQAAGDHQPVPVSFPFFEPPRPTTVQPADGVVSSGFGARWGTNHNGIDFAANMGSPIRSVTDGVVIEAGPATGFGLWVRVQQDDGSVGVYGHMQDILVSVGQQVRAGDVIATVGSRGQSTGPHLHYEVHQPGIGPVDPLPYLAGRGLYLNNPG